MTNTAKNYEVKPFGQTGNHHFSLTVNLGYAVGTKGLDTSFHLSDEVNTDGNHIAIVFHGKNGFTYGTRAAKSVANGGYEKSIHRSLENWLEVNAAELMTQIMLHDEKLRVNSYASDRAASQAQLAANK
jgi:hypothetical protein